MDNSYSIDGIAVHRLGAETLAKLGDGELAEAINEGFRRMAKSCIEDPGYEKPRKMTIEITMEPGRKANDLEVGVHVKQVALPPYIKATYGARVRDNGDVTFTETGEDEGQRVMKFEKDGE